MEILKYIPAISWMVWIYIWLGSRDILKVGRSKSGYRKLMKSLSFKDKFLRKDFVSLSKTSKPLQRFFVIMILIRHILTVIFIALLIISRFNSSFSYSINYYFFTKSIFIEIPSLIVVVPNLYRSKNPVGFKWKFEREYKK